jgi:hypothetical protein
MECLGGSAGFGEGSGGSGFPDPPPVRTFDVPPQLSVETELSLNQTPSPYANVHTLKVTATVNGILSYESQSLQPVNPFGSSRRHILYIEDANGNRVQPIYNARDEIGGAIFPEANESYEEYDERGNTIRTIIKPKQGSSDPVLTTTYTYEVSSP